MINDLKIPAPTTPCCGGVGILTVRQKDDILTDLRKGVYMRGLKLNPIQEAKKMRYSLAMQSTINVIGYLSKSSGKNYCYPSQEKILKLLERFYNVCIKRRQLNYILAHLEKENFIQRKRRLKKSKDGKIIFNTTLYWLKEKAWVQLSKVFNVIKRTGLKIKSLYDRKKEKEKESMPDELLNLTEEDRRKNMERLKGIMTNL